MAAGRGHLKVVQWFYENSVPGDIAKAISDANDEGHGEVRCKLRRVQLPRCSSLGDYLLVILFDGSQYSSLRGRSLPR